MRDLVFTLWFKLENNIKIKTYPKNIKNKNVDLKKV